MAKTNFDWKLAHEREDASKTRLNELAQKLESINNREVKTDEEKAQMAREIADVNNEIAREQGKLGMVQAQMAANMATFKIESREDIPSVAKQMREAIEAGQQFKIEVHKREDFGGNKSGYANPAATTNPDKVYTEDIVKPLYEASILSAAGVPQRTGLKGNHVYPVVEAFDVTLSEEAVAIGDSKISTSKLWAKPERASVAVPITRMALNETEGLLQTIFTEYAPAAAAELQNKIICSTTKVNDSTAIEGPFVKAASTNMAGTVPTLQELIALKTAVLSKKIQGQYMVYLMDENTKGTLECTPRWSGSDKAIIEDGKINGIPVVSSVHVTTGCVEFGALKYYPLDIFGDFNITIDPYSKLRSGAVDCVLDFAIAGTTLRQEAFKVLKPKA